MSDALIKHQTHTTESITMTKKGYGFLMFIGEMKKKKKKTNLYLVEKQPLLILCKM